jgi:hypothetical protein
LENCSLILQAKLKPPQQLYEVCHFFLQASYSTQDM